MATALRKITPFPWTKQRERAAGLCADGALSDEAIAAAIGVTRKTLHNWKQHPAFATRVEEIVEAYRAAVTSRGIADRLKRVSALNDRWERMTQVIAARADDLAEVPGGETGLLVRQVKQIGVGKSARVIDEYAVDTGLLRELREHEKQAAQELGQWTEKHDHSGEVVVRRYIGVDLDAV